MDDDPVLDAVETAACERFGPRPQRASVSFVGVEPIVVLRFRPEPGRRVYLTLGMARRPMTGVDEARLDADGPRAELLLSIRDPNDDFADVWRQLAVLAAAPAVEGVVYRPDVSVDLGGPVAPGSSCRGVVVDAEDGVAVSTPAGPVSVLPLLPATANELAWGRVRGAAQLRQRWRDQHVDLLDLTRVSVELGG